MRLAVDTGAYVVRVLAGITWNERSAAVVVLSRHVGSRIDV